MTCGIYQIVNKVNGKRYVGSSVDIERRWIGHRSQLNSGTHHSPPLQRAWNKYGSDAMDFVIIEECDKFSLIDREQFHIDVASEYNVMRFAGRNTGYKHTEQSKLKMSEAQRRIWTKDKRDAVSEKSLETWSRPEVKDKVIAERSSQEYKNQQSKKTYELWSDDDYRNKTLMALKSDARKEKLSIAFRSKEIIDFWHPEHGHVTCTQWELRRMFSELSASGVSQLCSGKQVKHKGWRLKEKAPEGA